MIVVVVGGPIASGKSAVARELASRLEERASVIDLDLVYEMLDSGPKDDADVWAQARRVAGRLTGVLLAEGLAVVAEGDFATDQGLREFETELPGDAEVSLVMLGTSVETALDRAQADPTRGVSKDPAFLSAHYAAFAPEWKGRDVLRLDTGPTTASEAAQAVVEWLESAR